MSTAKKIAIFLTVIATLVGSGLWISAPTDLNAKIQSIRTDVTDHPADLASRSQPAHASARQMVSENRAGGGEKEFQPLARLRTSTDLYALMHESIRHPRSGGIFYANILRAHCMNLRDLLAEGRTAGQTFLGSNSAAQQEAIRRSESLCSGFQQYELDPAQARTVFGLPGADQDPLLALSRRMREQLTDAEKPQVLRDALATRDPNLLSGPLTNLSQEGIAFDGELYASSERRDIYQKATQLLACDLGDVCDDHDLHVALACVATGACVSDRVELLRNQLAERDPSGASWREVLKLRAKLLDAIDRRDPGPFLRAVISPPPPSSPP